MEYEFFWLSLLSPFIPQWTQSKDFLPKEGFNTQYTQITVFRRILRQNIKNNLKATDYWLTVCCWLVLLLSRFQQWGKYAFLWFAWTHPLSSEPSTTARASSLLIFLTTEQTEGHKSDVLHLGSKLITAQLKSLAADWEKGQMATSARKNNTWPKNTI